MEQVECLVVGAGPAGLTAAIYLGRFRRACLVIDSGAPRAAWIPVSHNIIGYAQGIGGNALLDRLRVQATQYGARIEPGEILALERHEDGFAARLADRSVQARRVLLATGGLDVEPELPGIRDAVQRGLVRYCPICDAYEAAGKRVALIAYGKCRIREALLLRAYTPLLTVLTLGRDMDISPQERQALEAAGVAIVERRVERLTRSDDAIKAWHMHGGEIHEFDVIYSALGTRLRSALAVDLGAEADRDGALIVDSHQRTRVPGLFAAGDVVRGLSQVSVAAGQAAIAATTMNASLPFPKA